MFKKEKATSISYDLLFQYDGWKWKGEWLNILSFFFFEITLEKSKVDLGQNIKKTRCPDAKSTFKNIMTLDGSRIRSEILGQALKLVVEKLLGPL